MYINKILSHKDRCTGMITLSFPTETYRRMDVPMVIEEREKEKQKVKASKYFYTVRHGNKTLTSSIEEVCDFVNMDINYIVGRFERSNNNQIIVEGWKFLRKVNEKGLFCSIWDGDKEYHQVLSQREIKKITGCTDHLFFIHKTDDVFRYKHWIMSKNQNVKNIDLTKYIELYIEKDGVRYFNDVKTLCNRFISSLGYGAIRSRAKNNGSFEIDGCTVVAFDTGKERRQFNTLADTVKLKKSKAKIKSVRYICDGKSFNATDLGKHLQVDDQYIREQGRKYSKMTINGSKINIKRKYHDTFSYEDPEGNTHKTLNAKVVAENCGCSSTLIYKIKKKQSREINGCKIWRD